MSMMGNQKHLGQKSYLKTSIDTIFEYIPFQKCSFSYINSKISKIHPIFEWPLKIFGPIDFFHFFGFRSSEYRSLRKFKQLRHLFLTNIIDLPGEGCRLTSLYYPSQQSVLKQAFHRRQCSSKSRSVFPYFSSSVHREQVVYQLSSSPSCLFSRTSRQPFSRPLQGTGPTRSPLLINLLILNFVDLLLSGP